MYFARIFWSSASSRNLLRRRSRKTETSIPICRRTAWASWSIVIRWRRAMRWMWSSTRWSISLGSIVTESISARASSTFSSIMAERTFFRSSRSFSCP